MFFWKFVLAGAAAGAVNGLFGAGGGMILVPLLKSWADIEETEVFPVSISIMLPVCMVSLLFCSFHSPLPWAAALPYLIGSGAGGFLAGALGKHIPTVWLHRILGIFIIWGGWRYLC